MLRTTSLRVGLAILALAFAVSPVFAAKSTYFASLHGRYEIPPNDSKGAGVATFDIADDWSSIDFRLVATNIDGVTQAHIHCGTPDVNGPVVVFLYGFNAEGVSPTGILSEGTITNANVIPRPDSAACPGGVADLADVIEKIQNGGAYANVHTIVLPAGEIRGNIR